MKNFKLDFVPRMSPHSQMSAVRFASSVYRNKCKPFRLAWLCGQRPPLHEEQSFGLYGDRPGSCRKWALRLNRASLRREPETAGRYSFNHPKVARIPLCVVWRKSSDNPAVTAFLDILRASRPKIRKQMENLIRQSNEAA